MSIGQRGFLLSVSQGPLNGALLEAFPDFKGGKATTCTLVLDGTDEAEVFLKELGELKANGVITEEEFEQMKKKLIDEF